MVLTPFQVNADDWQTHPWLEDTFRVSAGTFFINLDSKLEIEGSADVGSREFDFERAFSLDDKQSKVSAAFDWRFGEKWSLSLQYVDHDNSGKKVLKEDIEWGDYVLNAGSNVSGGTYDEITRIFFGRKFSSGPKHEFGLGAGFHWMEIGAFARGEFILNGESTGVSRQQVSASGPLPNIGLWYAYAWSPRWLGRVRADWLSASYEEYSGGLSNLAAGVTFQATEHFAIGLDYNYFNLNVDVDAGSWKGGADMARHGPFLYVAASW